MKTILCLAAFLLCLPAFSQEEQPQPAAASPVVVERGPHHKVLERVTVTTAANGRTVTNRSRITVLGSGMHYWQGGQFLETKEEIEIVDGVAMARQGPHTASFSANLHSSGAIQLVAPGGQVFRSHILGLAYTDASSGQSVLIAEVKDCQGAILAPHQIIYEGALDGDCQADVRLTYSKSGFEQDIILMTAPPSPAEWGLNPATTRLEVFTEFIEAPEPQITTTVLEGESDPLVRQTMVDPDLTDQRLDFGGMIIGQGQAFPLGQEPLSGPAIPTGKVFQRIENRLFLIERVNYAAIREHLQHLPQVAINRPMVPAKNGPMFAASLPPAPNSPKGVWKKEQHARVDPDRKGFVLDYVMLNGSMTNFVFKAGETYFITNNVHLYGTTILEAAVVKFIPGPRIEAHGPIDCRTGPYRQAIFTARDDDSIGEVVPGSTGSPSGGYAASAIYCNDSATNFDLHDIRVLYSARAFTFGTGCKGTMTDIQVGYTPQVVVANGVSSMVMRNFLIYDCGLAFSANAAATNRGEHMTLHRVGSFRNLTNTLVLLTNSLLISVTNGVVYQGSNVETNLNDSGIFEILAAGGHYLPTNSPYLSAGTTNINPDLLALLKKRTVRPPIILSNDITSNTTLSPQAALGGNIPTLGYQYYPLDYLATQVAVTNATLTLQGGTVLGLNGNSNQIGLRLLTGAKLISTGTPTQPNHIVRGNVVQELKGTNWVSFGPSIQSQGGTPLPEARFRFTHFSAVAADCEHFKNPSDYEVVAGFQDCQFRGGRLTTLYSPLNLTNCLLDRVRVLLDDTAHMALVDMHAQNCLFVGGSLDLIMDGGNTRFANNVFDHTTIYQAMEVLGGWNGFPTNAPTLLADGVCDVVLITTNVPYETGPLGRFYLPTNSPFLNAGSTNANYLGLFHHTTTTNQVPEGTSMGDIGFHFIALNSQGQPLDSDNDSIFDHVEDVDGDGVTDAGETCFHDPILTIASSINYIKGSPPTRLDTNAVVFDSHSLDFGGGQLSVTVVTNADPLGQLSIRNQGTNAAQIGISGTNVTYAATTIGTFSGGSGANALTVAFNTNATVAAVQALARNLTFHIASNNPPEVVQILKFHLTDGDGGTNAPVFQAVHVVCPTSLDVMLVMDVSHSMSRIYATNCPNETNFTTDLNRFWTAKAAASNFVSMLDLDVDRIGLVTFAGTAILNVPLTNNGSVVQSTLYSQTNETGTKLAPPIQVATTNHSSGGSNALRMMVILSDGESFNGETEDQVKTAAAQAADAGIRVITIGFYTGECNAVGGTNLLRQIAASPHDYYFAPTFSEMQSNFNAVALGLCRGAPEVIITSPTNGQSFVLSPTNILITATATDPDINGSITNVNFFVGTNRLDLPVSVSNNVYTVNWRPAFGGNYALTAEATDSSGQTGVSLPVSITVNHPPSVAITNPFSSAEFVKPGNTITIQATAADIDPGGSVTNVAFYQGNTLVGMDASAPYSVIWTNAPAGTHTLMAKATDNLGAQKNSAAAVITIYDTNAPPVVNAGTNQAIRLPSTALLTGLATDDGLPLDSILTVWWSKISGPGTVTFANSNLAVTTASFSATGTYVLRLSATDSVFTRTNDTTAVILQTNSAPQVSAGLDKILVLGAQFEFTNQTNTAIGQARKDSKGTEFWLAFPGNAFLFPNGLYLFITSETNTTGTVTIPRWNFATNFSVTAGTVTTIDLGYTNQIVLSDVVTNLGIHIESQEEVTVYALSQELDSTDAYLALPTDAIGTNYVVLGWKSAFWPSQFAIAATADDTLVTITPSTSAGSRAAYTSYSINLDAGEAYQLRADSNDLSGTIIVSSKPISVFGGCQCANIPVGTNYCDYVVEHIPPTDTWGKTFITFPLATRTSDTFQIIASEKDTTVWTNGQVLASLNRGQPLEFRLLGPSEIVADKAVLLAHYSNGQTFDQTPWGDPFMVVVPPYEQLLTNYTFVTLPSSFFQTNFVNVIAPTGAVGQISLDGTVINSTNFLAIGNSGFAGAQLGLGSGSHRLGGPLPFGIFVYGFDSQESYGYLGGMSFASVAKISAIDLVMNPVTNQVDATECVTAIVSDDQGRRLSGILVNFDVVGSNPVSGSGVTSESGEANFCFTPQNTGTNLIYASVGAIAAYATNYTVLPVINLSGAVSDDGLPNGITNVTWSQVGGPLVSTFNSTITNTSVFFPTSGIYTFRLTADDTELNTFDEATVVVLRNLAPVVTSGPDTTTKSTSATLEGSASDDGLPFGKLAINWTKLTGPGNVAFSDGGTQAVTTASFDAPGRYRVRLTGDDSQVSIKADTTVTVLPEAATIECETANNTLASNDLRSAHLPGRYADFYRFTGAAGDLLTVEMTSTNVDSYLSLFTANLQLLVENDDTVGTNNARIVYTLPSSGDYFIEASSWPTSQTGNYSIHVGCGLPPSIAITTPTNGTSYATETFVEFVAEASDADGIDYIVLYQNGLETWTAFSSTLNYATTLFEGVYTYVAVAVDTKGNASTSAPVVVRIGVPSLELDPGINCPSMQATLQTATATLRDASGSPLAGTNVQFTISGANPTNWTLVTSGSGVASFTYAAMNYGRDEIQVTTTWNGVSIDSAVARRELARTIACNQNLNGSLSSSDVYSSQDRRADYFAFYGQGGDQVRIAMASSSFDTLLFLHNSACQPLATNDDFNGSDSKMSFTLPATGVYVIEASSYFPEQTGSYALRLECGPPGETPALGVLLDGTVLQNYDYAEFGATPSNQPISKTLTLTNSGSAHLLVYSVSLTGDFSLTNASVPLVIPPLSSLSWTLRFNAVSNGVQSGALYLFSDDGGGGESPFVINLSAIANPAGTPPTATLTAPASGTAVLPTNITISATASAATGTITRVDFVVRNSGNTLVIGRDTNSPYSITWNNPPPGTYSVAAMALDSAGRFGISTPVTLQINLTTNQPPVAVPDTKAVLANSVYNVFDALSNDTDPEGDTLRIISVFDFHAGTAQIINGGRHIAYTPPDFTRGLDYFRYTVSDGKGGTDSATIDVLMAGSDPVSVEIVSPTNHATVAAGPPGVTLQANVGPVDFSGKVEFFHNHIKLGEDTNPPYSITWIPFEDACECGITARATDIFGQFAESQPIYVTVTPPPGDQPPVAKITNLSNAVVQIPGHAVSSIPMIREGLFELRGDARDPDSTNVSYKIRVLSPAGELLRDLTPLPHDSAGFHAGAVTNGILGTNDFTLLRNGVYDLELTVRGGYRQTNTSVRFGLESEMKIGHFGFSEQDLVVPVNGYPITVVRTYNSLNPNARDFGRGWTFAVNDVELEIDEERELVESLFDDVDDGPLKPSGQFFSLRVGGSRNVTLTLPDGRRTTFYYYLEPGECNPGDDIDLCATPRWMAAPGVTASLSLINDAKLAVLPGGLEWWTDDGSSLPENYDFKGFILKTIDGTEYQLDRESLGEHFFVGEEARGNYANAYGKGRLTQIKQPSGDKIYINRDQLDPDGQVRFSIVHTNAVGALTRSVLCQRDEEGRIIAINDPSGLDGSGSTNGPPVLKYDYARGNLVRVHRLTDKSNPTPVYSTTTYEYTNAAFPHYITGIIDPRGINVARSLYDPAGRLVGLIDADGRTNHFHHDLAVRTETITNRLGDRTLHVYDTRGNVLQTVNALGENTWRGYDTNDNLLFEANALNQTNWFAYNTNHLRVGLTNALGQTNLMGYDSFGRLLFSVDALGRGVTNVYDAKGNLTNTVDALGNATAFLYDSKSKLISQKDALGNVTTNQYDSQGNLTTTAIRDAAGQTLSSTSYGYDLNGNQTNQAAVRTLADGSTVNDVTTSVYDAQNRVIQTIGPDGKTNAVVYNEVGQQLFSIDKLGRTNRYEYDAQGRLAKTTHADGTFEQSFYDVEGRRTNSVDRAGRATQSIYDKLGRVTHTVFADGTTNITVFDAAGQVARSVDARGVTNAFGYDAGGRRTSVTNALGTSVQTVTLSAYDAAGNLTNVVDALGRAVDYEFDRLNRRVKTTFPATVSGGNRATASTGYDSLGRRAAETNEAGVVTRFGYDGLGRLSAVTNAWGTSDAQWATYAYDEAGNQTNQVDALGRKTLFKFDSLGRRIARILPGGQTEGSAYDAAGNLLRQTNFNAQVITNHYDVMNQLLGRWHGSTNLESYVYNAAGLPTGRTDASGQYSWVYDIRDRVRTESTPVGTLYRQYDVAGNLTNLYSSTVNGVALSYSYDALNRLTNVVDHQLSGTKNTGYRFDGVGNLAALRYPNGVTNLWQYDARNRLTNEVWKLNSTALGSFAYQLGVTGNRTNLSETVNTVNRSYVWTYDSLYRLTNENLGSLGNLAYRYDLVSNRTNRTSSVSGITNQTPTFNTNDWLTSDAYDNSGNTRTNGSNVYLYDWANRLTNANNGAVVITYDAEGNRVKKEAGGVTTLYLVDTRNSSGYTQVLEELVAIVGTTNLTRAYAYGLDLISQREPNSSTNFFGYDGLGSTRFLTDVGGTIVNAFAYDAYGTLIASNGIPQTDYLFAGEQLDRHLGRYYLRARYLNPETGRFLTLDSHPGSNEEPLSLHKYLYAADDPVNRIDPSGMLTEGLTGLMSTMGKALGINAGLGGAAALSFHYMTRSLVFRLGAYAVLGTTVAGNVAIVTEAIQKTQPKTLDFRPAPKFENDDEPSGDLTVHRMGGSLNLSLREEEKSANPPGFSVLIGGTPQEAAIQFRTAFPYPRMYQLSKTVGSAKVSSVQAAGFNVVASPSRKLPNHGTLYHQSSSAAPFEDAAWLRILSSVFTDTYVP